MRADIVSRISAANERLQAPDGYIYDDEVDKYLLCVKEGIF